ncbi:MAG TPA: TetR/AcrR family transcriptional regulator C-terminal domain-containing protein [Candidatus Binatia bacterium]|nr:TetR/AcrR family transcriptional regulator C-terminal domain-containing protein [Candidatus Binatia bacterium]
MRAALALLERDPRAPLTVARIAAEVDAAPAALYRHFVHVDELLDAVLAAVLGAVALDVRPQASWPTQVREWMTAVRDHLLRHPAVLPLIGRHGRTSPAWLDAVSTLIAILERAGLTGAGLARAHLWIAETTVGIAMLEASLPLPEQIANARASIAQMSPHGRERIAALVPHLARLDGDALFAFVADRTIDALAAMVEAR